MTKINKKQVIYYSGQAFSGVNHSLELIGNNKGRIFDEHEFLIRGIDEDGYVFHNRIVEKRRKRMAFNSKIDMALPSPDLEYEIISLTSKDINIFWKEMDRLDVYSWNKNYNSDYCDGYSYEIKLRNPEGKAKYCSGHMNYPENILDFIIALNKLFKTNIKVYPE